jgi:hypothetical protein
LDGQRALSGGTVQLGVWAMADVAANAAAATMINPAMCPVRFMTSSRGGAPAGAGGGAQDARPKWRVQDGISELHIRRLIRRFGKCDGKRAVLVWP